MKFYYEIFLFLGFFSAFAMEVDDLDSQSLETLSNETAELEEQIEEFANFINYQPKSLKEIVASFLAKYIVKSIVKPEKSIVNLKSLILSKIEALDQDTQKLIICLLSKYNSLYCWKSFPHKIEHFSLNILDSRASFIVLENNKLLVIDFG